MAKGRMINRGIATDVKFNSLTVNEQWLFMRMLPFMDDYGRITGNIFELKMSVIPAQVPVSNDDAIKQCLDRIQAVGMIRWEENVVIQFLGFYKNQKIGHKPANSLYSDKYAEKSDPKKAPKTAKKGKAHTQPPPKYKAQPKDLKMVHNYFKDQEIENAKVNAKKFYDYYMANGWVQGAGKKPIKSWKHCLSSWNFEKKQKAKSDKVMMMCPNSIVEKGHDRRKVTRGITTHCIKCKASLISEGEYNFRKVTQGDLKSSFDTN